MDLATILGFVLGNVVMVAVMFVSAEEKGILMYWDTMSIVIVLGGAVCATMMRWPLNDFIAGGKVALRAIFNNVEKPEALIDEIVELAEVARKNSILALEKVTVSSEFLAKSVRMAVDGRPPETIDEVLRIDTAVANQRHKDGSAIFDNLGEAAPAFGMIGTVIGLIVIMSNLTDVSKIGPGLAVALVTTLYGAYIANAVFIPVASKLKFRAKEEIRNMELIRRGVSYMLAGENPRSIREKLESYLQK